MSKYKIFEFSKDRKYDVVVSETMSGGTSQTFQLLKRNVTAVSVPQEPLYNELLPVKEAKLNDVMKLSEYLSPDAQEYLSKLTATGTRQEDESDYK